MKYRGRTLTVLSGMVIDGHVARPGDVREVWFRRLWWLGLVVRTESLGRTLDVKLVEEYPTR